jgi:hypothetical protein
MRPSLTRLLGSSLAVTLLCLGTAASAQDVQEERFLRIQTPAQDLQVRISRNSIVGPNVQLVRDDDAVRGRAAGRSVYLRIVEGEEGEEELDGLAGAQPAWIASVSKKGGSLRLEGTFAGGPLHLTLGPRELSGTVGPCTYDLELEDEAYVGMRVCGGERQPTWVFLTPTELPEQVSPMLMTALVVVLGT